jgi:hypothetical protein
MGDLINKRHGEQFHAIAISRGRTIPSIISVFERDLSSSISFDPDVTIVHCGHNDLTYHPFLNKHPKLSKPTGVETIAFANRIQYALPYTKVFLSAVFPRTPASESNLNEVDTLKYNKVAKRHGLRIRTMANHHGFYSMLNNCMWRVVSNAQEEESLFLIDSLHLNDDGKKAVVDGWVIDILAELAYQAEQDANR